MHKNTQRVISLLTRKQVDFLDKIGKDALFSKSTKLSRTKIISALIDLMLELGIDGVGVSSVEKLKERIKGQMCLKKAASNKIINVQEDQSSNQVDQKKYDR